jgi:cyclase
VNYVWTGWVVLSDGILLIDSSLDSRTAAALADTIRARSGALPVKYLVNTHAHGDHTGGNRYFALRGATVIAQAKVAGKIDSTMAALTDSSTTEASEKAPAFKPSIRVNRKKVLGSKASSVEIIWLGKSAHTAGDLIVYLPKQKVLFAGDLISNEAVPWMTDPDMNRLGWIASVDSIASKAFVYDTLVPGHGVIETPADELRYTRGYLVDAYAKAAKMATWGTSVTAVRNWGYLGPYEDSEFYQEVHFSNMRRLYNEARGIKTPGRPHVRAVKN